MTEKEIISKSDDIIEAIVAISLGKGNILTKLKNPEDPMASENRRTEFIVVE